MTNLIAIAGRVADYPAEADRLRPTAIKAMRLMDSANLRRISRDLAVFVLGDDSAGKSARRDVAGAYAGLATSDGFDGPWTDGVLQALRLGSADLDSTALTAVRTKLASLPDDVMDVAWSPTVDLNLVTGPVVAAYVTRLSAAPGLENAEELALQRMVEFAKAGGKEPSLATLAGVVNQQLAPTSGAVPADAVAYFDNVVDALANTSGDEVDALATTLASSPRVDSGPALSMALRLQTSVAVRASVVAYVDSWLAIAALAAGQARALLEPHAAALSREGVDVVGHLARQWVASGDTEFASLALHLFPDTAVGALLAALAANPASTAFPVRAVEAVSLIGRDTAGLSEVARLAALWVTGATPAAALSPLEAAHLALQSAGIDCAPILDAVQSKIESPGVGAADLLAYARVVMAWDAAGIVVPVPLAASLTKRMAAVGVVDASAAKWSARRTRGSADARLLLIAVVADSAVPVPKILDAASATAGVFRQNHEVATALVARAAAEPDASSVRGLLEEATRWKRPKGDRAAFEANLASISTAKPEMDDLVNELRKA